MAVKKICDICGKEAKSNGRYELLYKCIISVRKMDICYECIQDLITSKHKYAKERE